MFFPLFFDPEYRSIGHPSLLSRIQATSKCQSPTSQCNAIILPHRSGADIFELSIDCESYVVCLFFWLNAKIQISLEIAMVSWSI